MKVSSGTYMPVLKWRMGEYMSLSRLSNKRKKFILPIFVIPPIEYDFENEKDSKTIDEHLDGFGKKLKEKWGDQQAMIELYETISNQKMANGDLSEVSVYKDLVKNQCSFSPVIRIGVSKQQLRSVVGTLPDATSIALRLSLPDLVDIEFADKLSKLLEELGVSRKEVDLIVDLGRPDTFSPYEQLSRLLAHYFDEIESLEDFRSFSLISTSLDLRVVKKPGGVFIRNEWLFYSELVDNLRSSKIRIPCFGDYSIEPPEFQSLDFRLMQPGAKVVYTTEECWFVVKGGGFRKNPHQMQDLCKEVVGSAHYLGPGYSIWDKRINDTAIGTEGCGNLTTWKQVGVGHHLTLVTDQVSSFHAL